MPQITYPHQRVINIHRERATANFLGIKNENWKAASCDLGAHALQLYLYLASNANDYKLALSPVAVRQDIGMARSTYHDQFHKLIDKGYLVQTGGNTYDFYEIPKADAQSKNVWPLNEQCLTEYTNSGKANTSDGQLETQENIQINNSEDNTNTSINTIEKKLYKTGQELRDEMLNSKVFEF